ncbi:MAG: hypothetical protein HQL77_00745 [Magnetococcales bacterium]|nr:hypothetical protein [Magnetococcales bacterium]MBF0419748.1 hypothetical protein [Magnetococcales bacterium]MBF0433879.1 hypothetical protein [Magnetococcales bacterium]
MRNHTDLFLLQQELKQPAPGQTKSPMDLKWLALDRFIALHEPPTMVNDSWTIPVWSGVAVNRGFVENNTYEDAR